MSHLGNHRLVLLLLLAIALAQPCAAQTGKGSGNTNTSTTRSTVAQPPTTTVVPNIILTGSVITMDGMPPPEPAAIERQCSGKRVRMGYTDSKGYFSLQLAGPAVMQDASETGRDAYTRSPMGGPTSTGFGPNSSLAGNTSLATLMGCELTAVLSGFQSSSVMIRVQDPVQPTDVGTIVLLKSEKQGSTVSATSLRAPKDARKVYEKASADMRKQKSEEAQAELQKAVKLYPQYAAAWSDLGWMYARQNRLDEARDAFAQARAADEGFVAPYVGLAAVAARESKWNEVLEFSGRATELDGVDFPSAYYYKALASYQLGQFDNAEKSARKAERLDSHHSFTPINLLLGTLLAQRQDYAGAVEEFKSYLRFSPNAANTDKVREQLEQLENLATAASGATSAPGVEPPKQ